MKGAKKQLDGGMNDVEENGWICFGKLYSSWIKQSGKDRGYMIWRLENVGSDSCVKTAHQNVETWWSKRGNSMSYLCISLWIEARARCDWLLNDEDSCYDSIHLQIYQLAYSMEWVGDGSFKLPKGSSILDG